MKLTILSLLFFSAMAFSSEPFNPKIDSSADRLELDSSKAVFTAPLNRYYQEVFYAVGNVPLGQSRIINSYFTNYQTNSSAYITSVFGGGDFSVLNDQCSGTTVGPGGTCYFDYKFEPTSKSLIEGSVTFNWSQRGFNFDGTPWFEPGTILTKLQGSAFDPPPRCESMGIGSIIGIETRSLKEIVPLVGLDFDLYYQSQFTPQYFNFRFQYVPNASFNKGGWTLGIHHNYQLGQTRLFLGTGQALEKYTVRLDDGKFMVVSPDGAEVYIFNGTGRHLETRTSLTGALKYSFQYDTDDRLIRITDAFNKQTEIFRDSNGFITSIQSPYGLITTLNTNSDGLIASVTNPKNETYSFTYKKISPNEPTALLETFTKPSGQVTTFTYDTGGKLIKDLGHGGNFWEFNSGNGVITMSSQMGRSSTYGLSYDSNGVYSNMITDSSGLATSITDSSENTYTKTNLIERSSQASQYDGRFGGAYFRVSGFTKAINSLFTATTITQSTDVPSAQTEPFNYTYLNKSFVTSGRAFTENFNKITNTFFRSSPEGETQTIIIDSQERTVSRKLGNDDPVAYSYDSFGRLSIRNQGSKNQLTYAYNSSGWLQGITNQRNETISYIYDLAGRVTSAVMPDARVIQFGYDNNGNLTSLTPPGRPAHDFQLNAMELTSEYQPPAVGTLSPKNTFYAYNLDKQLTQVTKPSGAIINYNYDSAKGLLNSISTTSGNYTFSYPNNDPRVTTVQSYHNLKNNFTYHGMAVRSEELLFAPTNFRFGRVSFRYDSDHRVVSRTVQGKVGQPVDTANIILNTDNKPTQYGAMGLTYEYPSGKLSTTTMFGITDERIYDNYGNLSAYTAKLNGNIVYSYNLNRDSMSRIVGKSETIQNVTTNYVYSYDTAGRLLEVKENGISKSSFVYDTNGNRTSTTIGGQTYLSSFDGQDRLTSFGGSSYSYNQSGELTQSQTGLGAITNFTNDSFGNLTQVNFPNSLNTRYYYDGTNQMTGFLNQEGNTRLHLYQDRLRIAATLLTTGVIQKYYYYPTNSMTPDYFKFSGIDYRIITDHLGSPRLVLRVYDGEIIQRMDYNVLGKVISDTSCLFQPFAFAGGLHDPDTNFVRFGARNYDAETGRWTSQDPIRFVGGDTNLYGYVLQDPVNLIDPTGLYWFRQGWQAPGVIGRRDTIVPPRGAISEIIEKYLPAGYTFGESHDAFVDWAASKGTPDWLSNIPSMIPSYVYSVGKEVLRSGEFIKQPTNPPPEQGQMCQ